MADVPCKGLDGARAPAQLRVAPRASVPLQRERHAGVPRTQLLQRDQRHQRHGPHKRDVPRANNVPLRANGVHQRGGAVRRRAADAAARRVQAPGAGSVAGDGLGEHALGGRHGAGEHEHDGGLGDAGGPTSAGEHPGGDAQARLVPRGDPIRAEDGGDRLDVGVRGVLGQARAPPRILPREPSGPVGEHPGVASDGRGDAATPLPSWPHPR
mmetsp:Transcript_29986/g.71380  ORF Transcript_29986/g.71380 Transcript_29986/m.71380 type:complete len:212 (-) Transcript_29986:1089-1724(-)